MSLEKEPQIRLLILEGVAEAHLRQFAKADEDLVKAKDLCTNQGFLVCDEISRARAVLALQRGQFANSRQLFLQTLQTARADSSKWLESTALLGLSAASLQEGRYDESLGWSKAAYVAALALGGQDIAQNAVGNLAWAYFRLGDSDRALSLLGDARSTAAKLGDTDDEIKWLTAAGYISMQAGDLKASRSSYETSLKLAQGIQSEEDAADVLTDLGLVAVAENKPADADSFSSRALAMAKQSGSWPDALDAIAVQMQAAALRGDTKRAEQLLKTVESSSDSQTAMKWACEDAMARLYESNKQPAEAQTAYQSALSIFESARAELQHEDSQLPFLANATRIYDDYIHFLVAQGKTQEALLVADQSRARTLAQGLNDAGAEKPDAKSGSDKRSQIFHPASFAPQSVARKAGATLLFFWLGERQSYLWAVTPEKIAIFPLPPEREIAPLLDRYRKSLLGAADPLQVSPSPGQALYTMLVAPAAELLRPNAPVMILADGALSQLNFETLIVPGADSAAQKAHYWIEDVTLSSAPSLSMLAAAKSADSASARAHGKLLLLGDPASPSEDYPELPYASTEMQRIATHFAPQNEVLFSRLKATPQAYLASNPRQFAYIHFVSHGVASRTDPLDSAIILSRTQAPTSNDAQDSFKLYAREVMQHPIDARLVTISACYGSGARAYAGEGLVGLSWAFLHAGAHSAIGALWEASDNSTPQLMDALYQGLADGQSPAEALRRAKLAMLHAAGSFRKPFYWAPFQLYTRL